MVQKKKYCFKFNSAAGCQRTKCSFLHEKIPKSDTDKAFALTCYTCGRKGHIAKNCRVKKNKSENKNEKDEKKEDNSGENESPGPVAFCFSPKAPSGKWIFDSGATNHITNDYSDLINIRPNSPKSFTVANSSSLVVSEVGDVRLGDVLLTEVYYSKSLSFKLISENKLVSNLKGADIFKDAKTLQVKVVYILQKV